MNDWSRPYKKSLRAHDSDDGSTLHMISHMQQHGYTRTGEKLVKVEGPFVQHFKGLGSSHQSIAKPFPYDEFKRLFLEWIICDNITLHQSASPPLKMIFTLLNNVAGHVIPISHNTP